MTPKQKGSRWDENPSPETGASGPVADAVRRVGSATTSDSAPSDRRTTRRQSAESAKQSEQGTDERQRELLREWSDNGH
jgi:hypothetical protein